jgi:hypothetical protein
MQQVADLNVNMTIAARLRHWGNALVLLGCAAASGCAALPNDSPVVEELDSRTGMTLARLGRPIELYRETASRDSAVRFAFLAPFETNRMGTRDLFLWVAVPIEYVEGTKPPIVAADGMPLVLSAPTRGADAAGLRADPYSPPTPWSTVWYYKADANTIAKLGDSARLTVRVPEVARDGTTSLAEYVVELGNEPRLRAFANR